MAVAAASMTVLSMAGCKEQERRKTFAPGEFKEWTQTPPMGWNSWDCYGPTVVESEVKAHADYMAENLKEYGWEYIVVDIRWFVANDKAGGYNQTDPVYSMDKYGRYTPAVNRFPSAAGDRGFGPLADYIHSKGLKFGIHVMRGIPKLAVDAKCPILNSEYTAADVYSTEGLCPWLKDNYTVDSSKPGAQDYYNSIMDLYASWGVDFLKIDDLSSPYHKDEIEMIRKAIDRCGRPIVLSTSPGNTPVAEADHIKENANMWRMIGDLWDYWSTVTYLMSVAEDWYPYIGDGTWPDCDMIPLGHLSIRGEHGEERMTRLTPDEQRCLMTFFCIVRSPLMFGGDLPTLDDFTKSLLTNPDLLYIHRYGSNVRQLEHTESLLIVATDTPKGTWIASFDLDAHRCSLDLQQ